MGPPSKAVKSVARTNSITKEYENFSRKVIEHARGNNDGFETAVQASRWK